MSLGPDWLIALDALGYAYLIMYVVWGAGLTERIAEVLALTAKHWLQPLSGARIMEFDNDNAAIQRSRIDHRGGIPARRKDGIRGNGAVPAWRCRQAPGYQLPHTAAPDKGGQDTPR